MQRTLLGLFFLIALTIPFTVHGQSGHFCDGFEEGWKTVKGELAVVPVCPVEPVTPVGSTPYREGIKSGIRAGQRAGGGNTGGGSSRESGEDFCDGFAVGWKTIKGDLAIVPICPIAPITPIGSTPYREGIKAGMAKARSS
ncbi:MAG: hypothetical protein AAB224_11040 [Gemmatimonadota bacterium]